MVECLNDIGIDSKDLRFIIYMYWNQFVAVRTKNGLSENIKIKRDVRQGCILSPVLFNLYTDIIFRSIHHLKGVVVGGMSITDSRYADDTALLAESEEELQETLNLVNNKGKELNMKMNAKKTKTMVITRKPVVPTIKIQIDGQDIEQVTHFTYLGQEFTEDGKNEREIKRRIEISRTSFNRIKSLITSKKIHMKTKIRLMKCYVWSILLYGAETWTLNKSSTQRLKAFETWCLRRMLKISWTEKKSNRRVFEMCNTKPQLIENIMKLKLKYAGHVMRHDSQQKSLLEGMVEGKRSPGRQRLTWMDKIKEWSGQRKYSDCLRAAENRERWRFIIANAHVEQDT